MDIRSEIIKKWRNQLFRICVILAVIGTLTEVAIYLVDSNSRELFLPNYIYQLRFIYIPSISNLIMIIITYACLRSENLSEDAKNTWSCVLIYFLCANTQFIHYVYGPLLMLPVIGIFLSVLFANKTLTISITIASLCSLTASAVVAANELRKGDEQLFSDVALAALVIIIACYASMLLIKYMHEQLTYIQDSTLKEKALINELHIDILMGIQNRKSFNEDIVTTYELPKQDSSVFLLMLDIDDFKNVNDTYGHVCGDTVLMTLGNVLKDASCRTVTPYRYGGEEIILILRRYYEREAYDISNKIIKRFAEMKYDFDPNLKITLSGGLAELKDDFSIEEWIAAADYALYEAKAAGKNCFVIYNKDKK